MSSSVSSSSSSSNSKGPKTNNEPKSVDDDSKTSTANTRKSNDDDEPTDDYTQESIDNSTDNKRSRKGLPPIINYYPKPKYDPKRKGNPLVKKTKTLKSLQNNEILDDLRHLIRVGECIRVCNDRLGNFLSSQGWVDDASSGSKDEEDKQFEDRHRSDDTYTGEVEHTECGIASEIDGEQEGCWPIPLSEGGEWHASSSPSRKRNRWESRYVSDVDLSEEVVVHRVTIATDGTILGRNTALPSSNLPASHEPPVPEMEMMERCWHRAIARASNTIPIHLTDEKENGNTTDGTSQLLLDDDTVDDDSDILRNYRRLGVDFQPIRHDDTVSCPVCSKSFANEELLSKHFIHGTIDFSTMKQNDGSPCKNHPVPLPKQYSCAEHLLHSKRLELLKRILCREVQSVVQSLVTTFFSQMTEDITKNPICNWKDVIHLLSMDLSDGSNIWPNKRRKLKSTASSDSISALREISSSDAPLDHDVMERSLKRLMDQYLTFPHLSYPWARL